MKKLFFFLLIFSSFFFIFTQKTKACAWSKKIYGCTGGCTYGGSCYSIAEGVCGGCLACVPNCSCANSTCRGLSCLNSCGTGYCGGNYDPGCGSSGSYCPNSGYNNGCRWCSGTKPPNCGYTGGTCVGNSWRDSCGYVCSGTYDPGCGDTGSVCSNISWYNSCGGLCTGTKNCSGGGGGCIQSGQCSQPGGSCCESATFDPACGSYVRCVSGGGCPPSCSTNNGGNGCESDGVTCKAYCKTNINCSAGYTCQPDSNGGMCVLGCFCNNDNNCQGTNCSEIEGDCGGVFNAAGDKCLPTQRVSESYCGSQATGIYCGGRCTTDTTCSGMCGGNGCFEATGSFTCGDGCQSYERQVGVNKCYIDPGHPEKGSTICSYVCKSDSNCGIGGGGGGGPTPPPTGPTPTPNPTPTPAPGPWWQVKDSDVQSAGDLLSNVPTGSYFGILGTGGFPGIPAYGGATGLTATTVSPTGWLVNSSVTNSKTYNYDYFANQIPDEILGVMNTVDTGDVSASLTTGGTPDANNYYWYKYDGTTNGNQPLVVPSLALGDRKVILMVNDADINITGNIDLTVGQGFFMVIIKGNINVDPSVGGGGNHNLVGLYFADGTFSDGVASSQLWVRGSVVANEGISLQRDLGLATDATTPAELFVYAPDQIMLFPSKVFGSRRISWKEVAP